MHRYIQYWICPEVRVLVAYLARDCGSGGGGSGVGIGDGSGCGWG